MKKSIKKHIKKDKSNKNKKNQGKSIIHDYKRIITGYNVLMNKEKNYSFVIDEYSNKDTYPFQIFSILILQDSMSHSEFYILRTVLKNYIRNNFKQGLISNM